MQHAIAPLVSHTIANRGRAALRRGPFLTLSSPTHPITFTPMRYPARISVSLLLLICTGCASKLIEREGGDAALFGPDRMRIHPIFTQVKSWNGDLKPDGIEAEIEFADQFGDPTKSAGKIMFELFGYRRGYPDPRGDRVINPWVGSLVSLQQQQTHWNRTSRTYSFQLLFPEISKNRSYVLTAMFEHTGGRRYFSQVILEAQIVPGQNGVPATLPMPATLPAPTTLPTPTPLPAPIPLPSPTTPPPAP